MSTDALQPIQQEIEGKLTGLLRQANALQVTDQDTYTQAAQIVLACRAEIKAIGFALDPGILKVQTALDGLKQDKQKFISRVQQVLGIPETRMEAWKRAEREATQREQERINAENRRLAAIKAEEERKQAEARAEEERKQRAKEIAAAQKAGDLNKREAERMKKESEAQAERDRQEAVRLAELVKANVPTVKVESAVPKVAGIKQRVNWKFTVTNASKLPRIYLKADEVAIGARVRAIKDKKLAEAEIPGITVESEDSV